MADRLQRRRRRRKNPRIWLWAGPLGFIPVPDHIPYLYEIVSSPDGP